MIIPVSSISYWGVFVDGTKEKYEGLDQAFDELFQNMADYALYHGWGPPGESTTFTTDLKELFAYAAENPLIVALITITILLVAFKFCPLIFRSLRR